MNPDLVHIRMLLTGAAEAVAEAESVQAAVAGTAASTGEANAASAASAAPLGRSSRAAQQAERSTSRLGRAHQMLGKAVMWGAGILGVGSVLALKAAYEHTQELGLATQKLSLQTGMNTRHASKWVEVTKARGIQSTQLSMGFSTLAHQMSAANQGTATSIDLFKRWGITQKDLKSMNPEQIIMRISDAFKAVHTNAGRAARAADIKTLFGRSGTALLPLMSMGSKGLQGQLGQAGGIDKGQLKQIMDARAAMRRLSLAVEDLKNKLAVALIPVILAVVNGLRNFVEGLVKGKSWAIAIAAAIGAVAVAFVALGVAAAIAWAIALGPAALVAAGIAALAAIFVVLYLRVGAFRAAVDAVWGFIRSHWRLLVAVFMPFVAVIILVVSHFRQIKSVASSVFNWLKGAAHTVASAVSGAFSGVGNAIAGVFRGVVSTVVGVINWLINAFNGIFDRTIDTGVPGVPVFHGIHLDPIGGGGPPSTSADVGGTPKGAAHGRAGGRSAHRAAALLTGSGRQGAKALGADEGKGRGRKGKGGRKSGDVLLDRRKVGVVMGDWAADEGARA